MIGQRIGPYRITRPLGRGGMGAVFAALQEDIGAQVAVKVLHPQFTAQPQIVQRFHDEAKAIAAVYHPGLVKIFDFGQLPNGTVYLLMEFLDGETLAQRLRALHGRLPRSEAVRIARQLASALVAAHQRGIVHCDLKPGNVMLVDDPEAPDGERTKLLDFGLAKMLWRRGPFSPLGQDAEEDGMLLGTPMYMAPEQCRGRDDVGKPADVYALGIMLYQMLAGAPPFTGQNAAELMSRQRLEPPAPLEHRAPEAGPELCALVARMLSKQPAERPEMVEVAVRLEEPREELIFSQSLLRVLQAGAPKEVSAAHTAPSPPTEVAAKRGMGFLRRAAPVVTAGLGMLLMASVVVYDQAHPGHLRAQLSRLTGPGGLASLGLAPPLPEESAPHRAPLNTYVPLTAHFRVVRTQREVVLSCNGARVQVRCFADAPFCSAAATLSPGARCQARLPGFLDREITYDGLKGDPSLLHAGSEVYVPLTLEAPRHRRKPA